MSGLLHSQPMPNNHRGSSLNKTILGQNLLETNGIGPHDNGLSEASLVQLAIDATTWWFNHDIPRVAQQLASLVEMPGKGRRIPLRLTFMRAMLEGSITLDGITEFCRLFQEKNDPEGVILATGNAIQLILDKGKDFSGIDRWMREAEQLLKDTSSTSPLARAYLLGLMGHAAIAAHGNTFLAEALFARQLVEIDQCASVSLRAYHAAFRAYVFYFRGDFSYAKLFLDDVIPLADSAYCSLVCSLYLKATLAFYYIYSGELDAARTLLDHTVNHPSFNQLPATLWLFTQSHRLLAYAYSGEIDQAETIAATIRSWSVPEYNTFYHSYLHFSLGVVALIQNQSRRALLHAEEAVLQAEKCHSRFAQIMTALLHVQTLADTGKYKQALDHIKKSLDSWSKYGFHIIASTGALEAAAILGTLGRIAEAREYFQKANDLLPAEEPLHPLHRTSEFIENINTLLFSDNGHQSLLWEQHRIRIQTLGDFRVEIGDRIIYDRQWRGKGTRRLLKLLIVHDGYKVSANHLADLLWPDADGSTASRNLKVAMYRLRRLGLEADQEPMSWLQLSNGRLSFIRSLCIVDALEFKRAVTHLLKVVTSPEELIAALELYQGDFLPSDINEPLVLEYRKNLRQLFVRATILLAEQVRSGDLAEQAIEWLLRAREMDHTHEKIHENLMKLYRRIGFPAKALQSYQYAQEAMRQNLGIRTSPRLEALALVITNSHNS